MHSTAVAAVSARAVGVRAAAALERSGGWVRPLAEWPDAPWAEAAGDIVWLAREPRTGHPRMVSLGAAVPLRPALRIDLSLASIWAPPPVAIIDPLRLRRRLGEACRELAARGPRGFACLLAGLEAPFPLDLGAPRLHALAQAYRQRNPAGVVAASCALLGFGTGLTPSGDDAVGAALFGARLAGGWDVDGMRVPILAAAAQRTHRLSAALLEDLADGRSYGLLHQLAAALDNDAPDWRSGFDRALRELGAVGHSSGWDMFAGLAIGAACENRLVATGPDVKGESGMRCRE